MKEENNFVGKSKLRMDLTGLTYGKLVVLERVANQNKAVMWKCRCSCGNECIVWSNNLKNGHTKSCGKCNTYINHGDFIEVKVKNGRSFFIDSEDEELVKTHTWSVQADGYVAAYNSGSSVISLHQFLMGFPKEIIDHADRNPSNNRRSNLRIATHIENMYNRKRQSNNTSGFIGVYYNKKEKVYIARVTAERVTYLLGGFHNAVDAALTRDLAALRYHGEFAHLNFPKDEVLAYGEMHPLKEKYPSTIKPSTAKCA
jgi:hypothetical protein